MFAESSLKTPKNPKPKTEATFLKFGDQIFKFTVADKLITATPMPAPGVTASSTAGQLGLASETEPGASNTSGSEKSSSCDYVERMKQMQKLLSASVQEVAFEKDRQEVLSKMLEKKEQIIAGLNMKIGEMVREKKANKQVCCKYFSIKVLINSNFEPHFHGVSDH